MALARLAVAGDLGGGALSLIPGRGRLRPGPLGVPPPPLYTSAPELPAEAARVSPAASPHTRETPEPPREVSAAGMEESFRSMSEEEDCRSPIGLDCCSCCLDLANKSDLEEATGGDNNNPGSPTGTNFRQLRAQMENLNTDKLNTLMRQDSLEPVLRDPGYLLSEGVCTRSIDQTVLSILLFFHSASGASVVAIDNKIEQAMDLVKNHLMYAVREEVEVLKEQIKELVEKNSQLEKENYLLKNLASPEQMKRFKSRLPSDEDEVSNLEYRHASQKHSAGSAV